MKYRELGKTGFLISEIGLGTWQLGGKWGEPFDEKNAEKIIHTAIDNGINFIDTADVYNDGMSERIIGKVLRSRSERVYVATKCGKQFSPHNNENYQTDGLRKFVEQSLKRLQLECLDLIQLHCPPTEVFYRPEIFELFETLKKEGKIQHLGVSVEKIEEALKAIEFENVSTVQIVFNMFRQRPAGLFFQEAKRRNIGILARVPLASGLLTGKFRKETRFNDEDHRNYNINGAAFDKGETFAGVNYEQGLRAVDELKQLFPNRPLAAMALKWILQFNEVSCVIPGASSPEQALSNIQTNNYPDLSENEINEIRMIYDKYIKNDVHHRW